MRSLAASGCRVAEEAKVEGVASEKLLLVIGAAALGTMTRGAILAADGARKGG